MAIGDPYNSLAEFKGVLGITASDEDSWITTCLNGARRAIERRSGWPTFWKTAAAELRTIDTRGKLVPVRQAGYSYTKLLLRDGIASSTGFVVSGWSGATLMGTDAWSEGNAVDTIKLPAAYASIITATLDITAQWGFPDVPADIKWAHQLQSHRYYRRKGSPEGIAGSAEWGLSRVPRLDPDVLGILKDGGYMRGGIG